MSCCPSSRQLAEAGLKLDRTPALQQVGEHTRLSNHSNRDEQAVHKVERDLARGVSVNGADDHIEPTEEVQVLAQRVQDAELLIGLGQLPDCVLGTWREHAVRYRAELRRLGQARVQQTAFS